MTDSERIEELEKRVKMLEKEYERIYHDYELLAIYIPRHVDYCIRFFSAVYKFKDEVNGDLRGISSFCRFLDTDIQDHFKSHKHTDKKRNSKY